MSSGLTGGRLRLVTYLFVHSLAVFSLSLSSLFLVAIKAAQEAQSKPHMAMCFLAIFLILSQLIREQRV